MAFKFERLDVWQKALVLTKDVHELTKEFPKDELYVLTSQMKRAADSVAVNIAEGSTGQSNPEFSRFLGYAIRSAIEVVACLYMGKMRDMINEEDFNTHYKQLEEIVKMLQALRNAIK
ncbi:MAG: four helix bundle protein [Tunicatimonas sp.]